MKTSDIAIYLYVVACITFCVIKAIELIRRLNQIPNLDISERGATLTGWQKICFILLPVMITFGCVLWQIQFPKIWEPPMPLWLICLLVISMLSISVYRGITPWWEVPIFIRQAADHLIYGVVVSFVILILITYTSEMLHP